MIPAPPGILQDQGYYKNYASYGSAADGGHDNWRGNSWHAPEPNPVEPDPTENASGHRTVTTVSMKTPDGNMVRDMYAVQEWSEFGLPQPLLDAIYSMDYIKPSKIQAAVLPYICPPKSENMIAQAQNGSGKTACFALAILTTIDPNIESPQALVLAPTRELVIQTDTVVNNLGKFMKVQCKALLPQGEPLPRSGVTAQVIVGTPGKVGDLCKKRFVSFDAAKLFVLDEADVMLNQENQMGPQVAQIRKNFLPERLQVLFFSATFPERVNDFAFRIVPNSHSVQLRKEQLNVKTISHLHKECYNDTSKFRTVKELFECLVIGQTIIFVNSRKKAFELAKWLRDDDHAVSLICGTQSPGAEAMDPGMRDKVMQEFRSGVTRVLVATDVLSRGIDVPAVTLVINYEVPRDFHSGRSFRTRVADGETYLHRVGRTGRFGMRGIAINLVDADEKAIYLDLLKEYAIQTTELPEDVEELAARLRELR